MSRCPDTSSSNANLAVRHPTTLIVVVVALCSFGVTSAFGPQYYQHVSQRQCSFSTSLEYDTSCIFQPPHVVLHASPSDVEEEARKLRELASQLRGEVTEFEQAKYEVAAAEQQEKEKIIEEKQQVRMKYSAEVPILKGDGQTVMERVDFPPRIPDGKSSIMACQADLPLGILLGEHEEIPGAIRVDEVAADTNGESAGVKEGDILRACTACQQTMETPTWQLLAGGIGQPKTKRFMFATDGRPFEEVMEAVASNRMDPEGRPVWLVLERPE